MPLFSRNLRSAIVESVAFAQSFFDVNPVNHSRLDKANERNPDVQMYCRKTLLTSAQILALNTTPITLVPAPGAGRAIIPINVVARLTYNSVAYATNTSMEIRYTNGSGTVLTSASLAALLTAVANKTQAVDMTGSEFTALPNAPIVVDVATGNPTAGNSTVEFTVFYMEVDAI